MWLGTMSADNRMPRSQARARRLAHAASPPRSQRDRVVVQRVGRRRRVRVAAPLLDPLRGRRALPQADQPQAGDAPAGEPVQLLVGDRVERPDLAPVAPRELVEPDVGRLRDEHQPRHPRGVAREPLRLGLEAGQVGRLAVARAGAEAAATEPQVQAALLLGHHVQREQEPVQQRVERVAEQAAPLLADVAQLPGERRRVGAGRAPAAARPASRRWARSGASAAW